MDLLYCSKNNKNRTSQTNKTIVYQVLVDPNILVSTTWLFHHRCVFSSYRPGPFVQPKQQNAINEFAEFQNSSSGQRKKEIEVYFLFASYGSTILLSVSFPPPPFSLCREYAGDARSLFCTTKFQCFGIARVFCLIRLCLPPPPWFPPPRYEPRPRPLMIMSRCFAHFFVTFTFRTHCPTILYCLCLVTALTV